MDNSIRSDFHDSNLDETKSGKKGLFFSFLLSFFFFPTHERNEKALLFLARSEAVKRYTLFVYSFGPRDGGGRRGEVVGWGK